MLEPDFTAIDSLLREAVPRVAPAAQLVVRWRGTTVLDRCVGWLDPDARRQPVQPDTLFDLASVTKLFVTAAFMTLVEQGRVTLDQPVASVLPELSGIRPIAPYEDPLTPGALVDLTTGTPDAPREVDASGVTFRQLLTHTSGLPAWRPLFRQRSAASARALAFTTAFAYPPGARVLYSDIGLILLGIATERLVGAPLDLAVQQRVTPPLGLAHTHFFRTKDEGRRTKDDRVAEGGGRGAGEKRSIQNSKLKTQNSRLGPQSSVLSPHRVAPTEVCAWRGRRVAGEVHDENAARLGGVSGHAGLFSTAADVAAFGQMFLDGGHPLLGAATVAEMARPQAEWQGTRRGLGFALWSDDPEASGNPFSPRAFGHTGFTGTSLWIDPARALVVALLTNDVYYGREGRGIGPLRVALHRAVVRAVGDEL